MTHSLAACAIKAAPRGTGATNKGKDSLKRDKYSFTGTGAYRFVSLSHETFGCAGPAAFALLNEIAEFAASSGVVSKRILGEHHARHVHDPVPRDDEASPRHGAVACPSERSSGGRGTACAGR